MLCGDQTADKSVRQKSRPSGRRARNMEVRRLARAQRLYDDGAFAAAETLYAQILADNPAHLAALRGRAAAVMSRSQTATAETGGKVAKDLTAIADQCYARGLYAVALGCYQRILSG